MRYGKLVAASGLTATGLALVATLALQRLPAGTQLPTHWGADGLPDRFADAGTALFMPVALTLVISLAMAALPSLEPLQDKLDRSAPLFRTVWGGLLALMAVTEGMIAAPAFDIALPPTSILIALGLFLVTLGNVLPKSRPGFFVGIRTPWAIIDPDNWIATHRYAGRITTGAGVAMTALAIAPIRNETRASFVIAVLLMMVATPILYSFFYWRVTRRA